MDDPGFWWGFIGKIGAPIFAGTLVACLLSGDATIPHASLMLAGVCMMGLSHWRTHRE